MAATTFISKLMLCITAAFFLLKPSQAVVYNLASSYSGATFYDNFNFATSDPSGGWVTYVDQETAQSLGYASASNTGAYLGVDYTNVYNPSGAGRNSVRIESKQSFTTGLFIGDFSHMPSGCGLWPAFWMYGPQWPNNGEIDIIEGVNNQPVNQISGHTNPGCVISGANSSALMYQNTCYQADNSGCYFRAKGIYSYGSAFNSVGGGVSAVQWTDEWISVWHWRRAMIPADITDGQPDPSTWGTPAAQFAGSGCNIEQHFNEMTIVLNIDFCGGWAQSEWSGCPGSSCIDYVAANPSAFQDAYWQVNYIDYYTPPFSEAFVSGQSSGNSTSQSSVVPLASTLPNYKAPADAMGAASSVVIGPPAPTSKSSRRRARSAGARTA